MKTHDHDVVIVGGGPAGATCATLLQKYAPRLDVLVLERETFPRDHVGESQLPVIGHILGEMGVWDDVERANFPVKIGATYRWGRTDDLWNFEFIPNGGFQDQARPAKFAGQRIQTAFQVDRAIYDDILLKHARKMGAKVRENVAVRQVNRTGDRVDGLVLDSGETVTARHYVDATGHAGVLRRAMGVETHSPTTLQNIAIWDYWQNAEWAVEVGVGGTRVQVMSLGYGWLWFIPLGPTRTSIGLIVPAEYYKKTGKRPKDLYAEAIAACPVVSRLTKNATPEGKLATTKDWSFLADRLTGENWFLAGESCGFADPILAAGMSLAHIGARDVAYTILALDRQDYDADWLKARYDDDHRRHIRQHIRFADYWYTHNGHFSDLQEEAARIAGDAGRDLSPQEAWRWLGTGGFIESDNANAAVAGYSVGAAKAILARFTDGEIHYEVSGANRFAIDLEGATRGWGVDHNDGRIERFRQYERDGKKLPMIGVYRAVVDALKPGELSFTELNDRLNDIFTRSSRSQAEFDRLCGDSLDIVESMTSDGWVKVRKEGDEPGLVVSHEETDKVIVANRDPGVGAPVS